MQHLNSLIVKKCLASAAGTRQKTGMATLEQYLRHRKACDLAQTIGRSQSFVSELKKGTRKPSFATMRAIHDATDGIVSYADWHNEDAP